MREGWTQTTLGELASINPEAASGWRADKRIQYIDLSSVSFEDGVQLGPGSDIIFGEAPGRARRVVRAGDVLVATVRPYLRGFAQVPEDLDGQVASTGFAVLRATTGVEPGYLWALVRTDQFVDFLMERATGSNYPAVRPADVAAFPVNLPPLLEQRRMVDLISSIDHAISEAEVRISASETALNTILSERLDFTGGTPMMRVNQLAMTKGLVGGPFGSSLVRKDYTEAGVPVIRGTNMTGNGQWVGGDFAFVSEAKAKELSKNTAEPGDVVFTQRGTLGQVALVPSAPYDRYVVSQSQMRLRPNRDLVSSDYVYWCFRTPGMVSHVKSLNAATANPHINLGILGAIELPVPSRKEQDELVRLVESVNQAVEEAQKELGALRTLRAGVLAALISGTRRIPESYDRFLEVAP